MVEWLKLAKGRWRPFTATLRHSSYCSSVVRGVRNQLLFGSPSLSHLHTHSYKCMQTHIYIYHISTTSDINRLTHTNNASTSTHTHARACTHIYKTMHTRANALSLPFTHTHSHTHTFRGKNHTYHKQLPYQDHQRNQWRQNAKGGARARGRGWITGHDWLTLGAGPQLAAW